MALKKQWETYQHELPALLDRAGKFALIKGDDVVDVLDTFDDAMKDGYRRFGLAGFMEQQISAVDAVEHFTRDTGSPSLA